MQDFLKNGLRFECVSCGYCCRYEPGYVFLSSQDLSDLADFKNMNGSEFTARYCRTVNLNIAVRLSLKETSGHDCIFWDQGCTVYPARPQQCRSYPFWPALLSDAETWNTEAGKCPGMNQGKRYSAEEINSIVNQRRELLSPDP